jgi:hypothetical protein
VSLLCLSCHDGTVAVSSIDYYGYDYAGASISHGGSNDLKFIRSWVMDGAPKSTGGANNTGTYTGMISTPNGHGRNIGTDLSNDHPVGIEFPAAGSDPDFKDISGTHLKLFTVDGVQTVQCATCHNPHGSPSDCINPNIGGGKTGITPEKYLREDFTRSTLCLTCHNK